MPARLTSDFWVSAYLRRCGVKGITAVLRRRGAPESGAIFVKVDRLDGTATLYAPAPQAAVGEQSAGRLFARGHDAEVVDTLAAEDRLRREIRFDSDLWIVEVEDRAGRHFLDLVG